MSQCPELHRLVSMADNVKLPYLLSWLRPLDVVMMLPLMTKGHIESSNGSLHIPHGRCFFTLGITAPGCKARRCLLRLLICAKVL